MEKKIDIYRIVTERVMEQLSKGVCPWHRPWTGLSDGAINYKTRKPTERAFDNSVAYINGWLRALENDTRMIVWAASRAEKAARYILNKKDG